MLNFFKGLFSAGDIAKTGAEMAEKAFFTEQEKSAFMLEYLKASAPMAISRRFIAITVAGLWALCVVVAGALLFTDRAAYSAWSGFMESNINTPFSVIMAFYFLAHVVRAKK